MPQVKYIGICIKTDSINGVGLRWEPGQVRNVNADVAERLLAFTDTWASETGAEAANAEPIGLTQTEKAVEEPLPVVDFHSMDKKAMAEYSQRHYNVKQDMRQPAETMRHQLIAMTAQHYLDSGN